MKEHFLYVDTTDQLTLGLVDQDFLFLNYTEIKTNKSSELIHSSILNSLNNANVDISLITKMFLLSGPGSYTGMRVGEGIAKIFEWQNLEVFSHYWSGSVYRFPKLYLLKLFCS